MLLHRLALFVCVVAVVAALWQPWSTPGHSTEEAFSTCRPTITRRPIPTRTLAKQNKDGTPAPFDVYTRRVRGRMTPLLMRGDVLSLFQWRVAQWGGEYFSYAASIGRGPSEFLIKRSSTPVVRFANLRLERPFVRRAGDESGHVGPDQTRWPQMPVFEVPFSAHNVSVASFFDELKGDASGGYPYFADGISVLGDIGRDLRHLEPLCPFDDLRECDMSLWIGQAGVIAYPHYDSSQNLFAQLIGRKKFTLASPAAARCGAGLSPSLHPFYRQVQRDIFDAHVNMTEQKLFVPITSLNHSADGGVSSDETTCSCGVTLYESTLEPGDVLFIPTGWFHRVESMTTPSFSINSWWNPPDETVESLADVLQQPLPFQADWTTRARMFATATYVRMVYSAMESRLRTLDANVPSGAFLAQELLVTRYHPLFDETLTRGRCADLLREIDSDRDAHDTGLTARKHITTDEMRSLFPEELRSSLASETDHAILFASIRAHFQPYVDRVLALYQHADAELARLHVQNYVEEVLWFAVDGRVDLLYPYLACNVVEEDA